MMRSSLKNTHPSPMPCVFAVVMNRLFGHTIISVQGNDSNFLYWSTYTGWVSTKS